MRLPPLARRIRASRDKRLPIPVKGHVSIGFRAVVVLPQVIHYHLPLRVRQIKQGDAMIVAREILTEDSELKRQILGLDAV